MREIAMFILIVSIIYTVVIFVWANKLYLKRKQREWIKRQNFYSDDTVIIPSNGQLTIPKGTQDALGLKAGDRVRFLKINDGAAVITQANE